MASKSLLLWISALTLIMFSGCAGKSEEAAPAASAVVEPTAVVELPAAVDSDSADSSGTAEVQLEPADAPAPEPLAFTSGDGTMGIDAPAGWFSTTVAGDELTGLVFMNQDPDQLALFDDAALALPLDFAAGALIRTPLPPNTDVSAMLDAVAASAARMTDSDLQGMLLGVSEVGLLRIESVGGAVLESSTVGDMAGRTALVMEGVVQFVDQQPPDLKVQVWMTWTEQHAVVYYAMAASGQWDQAAEQFVRSRHSIRLP